MNITSTSNPISPEKHFGFWGRLSLSRKLLLAFGALFVFALIIAAVTMWGLNRTQAAYEETLTQGVALRNLSDQFEINLLQARRNETDFRLYWQSQGYDTAYANYATLFYQRTAAMRESLKQLAPFGLIAATVSTGDVTQAQYNADWASLSQNTDTFENSFTALIAALKSRGANENTGLEGEMRTAAHNIEAKISDVAGLEPLEITLLQMRRHEKDYLARQDQTYIDQLHTTVIQLKVQITETDKLDPAAKSDLRAQADAYIKTFDEIVAVDQEIAAHIQELDDASHAIEPLSVKITTLGAQLALDTTDTARAGSTQTFTFSIVTVIVVLALSILLAIFLSRQLTRPVTQLTKTAEQIASGNFEAQAEVSSGDEVGALAQTFNTMTSRLRQAFEDVRRRALAVQTSAEVSRRLSVASSPNQLAVDVVEQVQEAFKYYHAHIYFLDEASGDLVMAGGTGEAGATLLARGHKVPKGRGLVGRAADTNAPVLVPDVSQAEGWLPNPLLPDTKSEVAIPISSSKQVLGVLDVQQNIVNGLDEEDVALLQSLAGQVAISLQNARSFEESKAQADLESMVNAIGQKIQRATTVDDTLQTAIREIGLALGASRVRASIGRSNGDDSARNN